MFLSFEGIDGSGKSTQAALLAETFLAQGREVLSVREPGGTALGESIRALLLDPARHVEPRAELLLFSAARAQMVEEIVRPALARGAVVVADRFFDSSTAYQGAGRGLASNDWMENLHAFATNGIRPDRTFVVDVDPVVALARRESRGPRDRMEMADTAFHVRVREAYLRIAEAEPDRVTVLDGSMDREALRAQVWDAVHSIS